MKNGRILITKKKENEDLITFHLIQAIAMVFLKSNNQK